jgi:hypothetical protein
MMLRKDIVAVPECSSTFAKIMQFSILVLEVTPGRRQRRYLHRHFHCSTSCDRISTRGQHSNPRCDNINTAGGLPLSGSEWRPTSKVSPPSGQLWEQKLNFRRRHAAVAMECFCPKLNKNSTTGGDLCIILPGISTSGLWRR